MGDPPQNQSIPGNRARLKTKVMLEVMADIGSKSLLEQTCRRVSIPVSLASSGLIDLFINILKDGGTR